MLKTFAKKFSSKFYSTSISKKYDQYNYFLDSHIKQRNTQEVFELLTEMVSNKMTPEESNSRKILSLFLKYHFSKIDQLLAIYHENQMNITNQHYLTITKKYLNLKNYDKLYELFLELIEKRKSIEHVALKSLVVHLFPTQKEKAIKLFDLLIQNEFEIEFDLKLIFINRFLTLKDSERFQILFSLIVEKNEIGNLDNLLDLLLSYNQVKHVEILLNYMIERKIEPDSVHLTSFLISTLDSEPFSVVSIIENMVRQGMTISPITFNSMEAFLINYKQFGLVTKMRMIRAEYEKQ
jgi:pentatricopeptide repeat protein